MKKRGQLQLSFGMIFSIIIIIATVSVAIYFIVQFLQTSKCAQIELFKSSLEDDIDAVWKSSQSKKEFSINLPSNVEEVCFGNLSSHSSAYSSEYSLLRRYSILDSNMFILPTSSACEGTLASNRLNHIYEDFFFCVNLDKGKGTIILSKSSSSQSKVEICKDSSSCIK